MDVAAMSKHCVPVVYPPAAPIVTTVLFAGYAALDMLRTKRHAHVKIQSDRVASVKVIVNLVLPVVLFAHLCWSFVAHRASNASRTSVAISLFAALNLAWISLFYQKRSIKPSTVITLYLLVTLATDLYNLFVFVAGDSCEVHGYGAFKAIEASTRFVMLCAESRSKTLLLESEADRLSPMETAGILSTTFFWWVNPILKLGGRRNLKEVDIPPLETEMRSKVLRDITVRNWAERKQPETKLSLVKTIFQSVRPSFLAVIGPRLVVAVFRCSQPLLIGQVISFIQDDRGGERSIYDKLYVVMLAIVVYGGLNITTSIYEHKMNKLRIVIHGSLVSLIYSKTLSVAAGADAGQALTLMSSDVEGASHTGQLFNDTWGFTLEAVIGLVILAREVGWLFIVPVVMILSGSRVGKFMAENLHPRQKAWNEAKQARMSALSSVLGHMKSLKAMGLTDVIAKYVESCREAEQNKIDRLRWMNAAHNSSANAIGLLSPTLTMILYAIMARVKHEPLDIEVMFKSIAVLATVTHPANMVITVIPVMISFSTSFERIQDFLLNSAEVPEREDGNDLLVNASSDPITLDSVTVSNGSRDILSDVSLSLPARSLTICCGQVGSGKSVLSRVLLGEMLPTSGKISRSHSAIGYCDQTAWIPSGTVRDIVCGFSQGGGSGLTYSEVITACCLDADIQRFPSRDMTLVGSRGVNLSGGQKQRLAMARLLYSGAKFVIFDDSFAALDGTTESTIVNNLFGKDGILKKAGIVAFWITNSAQYFDLADSVVVLDSGKVEAQGPWKSLSKTMANVKKFEFAEGHHDDPKSLTKPKTQTEIDAEEDVDRRSGDFSLYMYYFRAAGFWPIAISIICPSIYAICTNFGPYWVKVWTSAGSSHFAFYASVYFGLSLAAWAATSCQMACTYMLLARRSATVLHQRLVSIIFLAPLSFFALNDVGAILNRFGQDVAFFDGQLPNAFSRLVTQICKMTMHMVVLVLTKGTIVWTVPISALIVYGIASFYLRTSRQLRVMEIEAKATLFNRFAETIDGIASIRAFNWQGRAEEKMLSAMDIAMQPNYLLFCIQRWLGLVLELLVATIAVIFIILAVFVDSKSRSRYTSKGDNDAASSVGVGLIIIILANATLLSLVYGWTSFETALGAVSRLKTLEENTPKEDRSWETTVPPASWPSAGNLVLRNVSIGYTPDQPVLSNVNLNVKAGQKLVICGRTGSGKSTIFLSLLRLIECSGQMEVDGVNITRVPRSIVRSRAFIAVPQDGAVLAKESLRFNLDPQGVVGDSIIIATLRKTHLWKVFCPDDAAADETILDKALSSLATLSVGQSQLLALARAIIQKHALALESYADDEDSLADVKPIVLLDEATSSLDSVTEANIYDVIEDEFVAQGHTVIIVSHRLGGLVNRLRPGRDAVAVLANGTLTTETDLGRIQELAAAEDAS